MKKIAITLCAAALCAAAPALAIDSVTHQGSQILKEELKLGTEWDKVFPKSDKVDHAKVTFVNRFGITLAADLYLPKDLEGRLPAIAVSGPFGAVKEQSSGLYAQTLAERGFITLAFDPSFTGESGGYPRYLASPDINTEDFQAAVDYLLSRSDVDPEKVGILGICGWGGYALNAAAIDTRVKGTVAVTMYNLSEGTHDGYQFAPLNEDELYALKERLNAQRTADFKAGEYKLSGGLPDVLPEDAPQFVKDYYAYYKTERGYHSRSLNSNGGWNMTSSLTMINSPQHVFAGEIRNPVLIVHGANAHSRYFSEEAFAKLKGDNKELYLVPNASHTDLYDNFDKIPLDLIVSFYQRAFL